MKGLLTAILAVACACAQAAGLDVLGKPDTVWNGAKIWRDLKYGPRPDAPGEGEGYRSSLTKRHPHGHVIHSHRSGQFYDLMAPEGGVRPDTPVYMHLHGGAWCAASDKDGESFLYLSRFVQKGFLVVNVDYQLQTDALDDHFNQGPRAHATFVDMLRDLDASATHLKVELLPKLGIEPRRFAIGGGSAGAHLSLLYAWDQDNPSVLNAGLRHDYRVGFAIDVVGPVDLASDDFLEPLWTRKMPMGSMFNDASLDRLIALCGWLTDYDLKGAIAAGRHDEIRATMRRFSPTHLATPNSVPVIMAYCQLHPLSKTDGCVPVSMYRDLRKRLDELKVPHVGDVRTFRPHGWLREGYEKWIIEHAAEYAKLYLAAPKGE